MPADDQPARGEPMSEQIWKCTIGGQSAPLPPGSDWPMRVAVRIAFEKLAGRPAEFCFSGWGAKLSEAQRAVVEDREPNPEPTDSAAEIARLREEVNVAEKFHAVAVKERDYERTRNTDLLAEITRLTAALEEEKRSVEVVSASLSRCDQARADAMADRDFCLDRIWNAENVDLVSPHGFHPASTRGKLLGILARAGIVTIVKNDSECVSCRRALARAAEGE